VLRWWCIPAIPATEEADKGKIVSSRPVRGSMAKVAQHLPSQQEALDSKGGREGLSKENNI
jgi:hypothetical protein